MAVQAYGGDDKTQLAEGKLTLIDNEIDQATGTIHLKAHASPMTTSALWPGEFVNVRLVVGIDKNAVDRAGADRCRAGPNGHYALSSSSPT